MIKSFLASFICCIIYRRHHIVNFRECLIDSYLLLTFKLQSRHACLNVITWELLLIKALGLNNRYKRSQIQNRCTEYWNLARRKFKKKITIITRIESLRILFQIHSPETQLEINKEWTGEYFCRHCLVYSWMRSEWPN